MEEWVQYRDEYLAELLRLDGLESGSPVDGCFTCGKASVDIPVRCLDCSGGRHFCAECVVKDHRCFPTHRIEVSTRLLDTDIFF